VTRLAELYVEAQPPTFRQTLPIAIWRSLKRKHLSLSTDFEMTVNAEESLAPLRLGLPKRT